MCVGLCGGLAMSMRVVALTGYFVGTSTALASTLGYLDALTL